MLVFAERVSNMIWTDDPVRDAETYAEEMEDRISELPVCCECGEHIQDDCYYDIEGQIYCESCLDKHRQWL